MRNYKTNIYMQTIKNFPIRYWGKKPPSIIQRFIRKYSRRGDIVVDLFGGSGSIVATALSLGRKSIYVDLNPYACMIADVLLSPCKIYLLQKTVEKLLSFPEINVKLNDKQKYINIKDLFSLICKCGRPVEFSSMTFDRKYIFTKKKEIPKDFLKLLKRTGFVISHTELLNYFRPKYTFALTQYIQRLKAKNVLIETEEAQSALIPKCGCGVSQLKNIKWKINGHLEPVYWFPRNRLEYRKGIPYYQRRDVHSIDEFFVNRSLCYLAWLWHEINNLKIDSGTKRCLKLIFLNTTARASKMNRIAGGPWLLNSYWIPRHFIIRNPRLVFQRQAIQFINYKRNSRSYLKGDLNDLLQKKVDFTILCGDARKTLLPANSIDYIITDPPHMADAQFLELSTFFTSWLHWKLPFKKEIVVNPRQGKNLEEYIAMLYEVLKEINRILKYDRYFTLILPSNSQGLYEEIKLKALQLGFHQAECIAKGGFKFMTFKKQK